jgi:Fe-S cluster assembly iron-binding protein IscA
MQMELSPAAAEAARRDLGEGRVLRIAFAGGCGAMGFRLAAARRAADGDLEVQVGGLPVLLDPKAAAELDGARLDYDEELGFVLDHPAWGMSC